MKLDQVAQNLRQELVEQENRPPFQALQVVLDTGRDGLWQRRYMATQQIVPHVSRCDVRWVVERPCASTQGGIRVVQQLCHVEECARHASSDAIFCQYS